jgi:ribosomal protein L11 methyltransferase
VPPSPALDVQFASDDPAVIARVTARLDDLALVAVHETGPDTHPHWRVFFASAVDRGEAETLLRSEFPHTLSVSALDVPDDDWAARSQASLRAVRVGRVTVAPPWDRPATVTCDTVVVVIKPSMGFGTGHHETTRLCLELLQQSSLHGRRVLDVGTGSGVLALAAVALGAAEARGIDSDADAIACAQDNLRLNRELEAKVTYLIADAREPVGTADLVLANLTGAMLMNAVSQLLAVTAPEGELILSGFQPHEAGAVLEAFETETSVIARRAEGAWEAALLRRHS